MTIDELYEYILGRYPHAKRDSNRIEVSGSLDFPNLTTLPDNVTLSAGGSLYLPKLTTLADNVRLLANGSLDLSSLMTLPYNVTLSAGNLLYLPSLTEFPADVTLSAGGSIYLSGLRSEVQEYGGQTIRLRTIDDICTRLISSRRVGGVTVWSGQYFRGHLDTDPRCYVACEGEFSAHGASVKQAMRDLRFKIAQVNFDASELVETIKRRGTVRFEDYRLLTGACSEGLEMGMRERGLDPLADAVPLADVLRLCADGYGGQQFISLFAK